METYPKFDDDSPLRMYHYVDTLEDRRRRADKSRRSILKQVKVEPCVSPCSTPVSNKSRPRRLEDIQEAAQKLKESLPLMPRQVDTGAGQVVYNMVKMNLSSVIVTDNDFHEVFGKQSH